MPQSKKRGGSKAHRKKIQNRNGVLKNKQVAIQKMFEESINSQVEEQKKKNAESSGKTDLSIRVESV